MATPMLPTLDGEPLRINAEDIRWNFSMKTFDTKTMGGKVIQILGVTLSDITLRGHFGPGRRDLGHKEGWEEQLRFRDKVDKWADRAVNAPRGQAIPMRFTYPPRGWDFRVFIRKWGPVHHAVEEINPPWEMVLFPFDDGARKVVDSIKDLYIQRLMEGVGWKQSDYNGPTQAEVDERLAPYDGSIPDYLRDRMSQAFEAGESSIGPRTQGPPEGAQ